MEPHKTFEKYFMTGEQVCVGGIDWQSHGYITKITKEGIWLTQLNNTKELLYSWNNWEVVYHPSVRITHSTDAEVAHLFNMTIKSYNIEDLNVLSSPLTVEIDNSQIIIKKEENKIREFSKFIQKDKIISHGHRTFTFEIKVNDAICLVDTSHYFIDKQFKKYHGDNKYIEIIENKLPIRLIPYNDIFDRYYYKKGNKEVEIRNKGEIDLMRKMGFDALYKIREKEECVSVADPYIFTGRLVDQQVFQTKQGYIMASPHGELYISSNKL